MNRKNILILGGYGNTGKLIARYILQESGHSIVIAGPNKNNAELAAAQLNRIFDTDRAKSVSLNASDPSALGEALVGVDLLVAASSTAKLVNLVAQSCLHARVDYFDVQFSPQKVQYLKKISKEIQDSGCCFVTDGGFHPGLPAMLIRLSASYFDELYKANVGSVIKEDWSKLHLSESTVIEMAEEFPRISMTYFRNGKWKKARLDMIGDMIKMDFGAPFYFQNCIPMFLEELARFPEIYPTLTDTGFFVGGFNPLTDYILMPIMLIFVMLAPKKGLKPAGHLLLWGLRNYSKPPFGIRLKLEASGKLGGEMKTMQILLSHEDGYVFTAIPAAVSILQMLNGNIRKPGLFTQGEIVDPNSMLNDMCRLGISVNAEYPSK